MMPWYSHQHKYYIFVISGYVLIYPKYLPTQATYKYVYLG